MNTVSEGGDWRGGAEEGGSGKERRYRRRKRKRRLEGEGGEGEKERDKELDQCCFSLMF